MINEHEFDRSGRRSSIHSFDPNVHANTTHAEHCPLRNGNQKYYSIGESKGLFARLERV